MMPHSLAEECEDYVDAYGDQVIELLAQEIDPSQVRKLELMINQLVQNSCYQYFLLQYFGYAS